MDPVRRASAILAVSGIAVALAGCGSEQTKARPLSDPQHHAAVAKDPYRLTCDDIARQPLNSTNQRLVIDAEFALARGAGPPQARRDDDREPRRAQRVLGAHGDLQAPPGRLPAGSRGAVDAVRRGKYLVQPRPKSWSRPELWSKTDED